MNTFLIVCYRVDQLIICSRNVEPKDFNSFLFQTLAIVRFIWYDATIIKIPFNYGLPYKASQFVLNKKK